MTAKLLERCGLWCDVEAISNFGISATQYLAQTSKLSALVKQSKAKNPVFLSICLYKFTEGYFFRIDNFSVHSKSRSQLCEPIAILKM